MRDLEYASKEKAVPEHDVIDEAIKEKAAVCQTMPVDVSS